MLEAFPKDRYKLVIFSFRQGAFEDNGVKSYINGLHAEGLRYAEDLCLFLGSYLLDLCKKNLFPVFHKN